MSTIPRSRNDLLEGLSRSFAALEAELDELGPDHGDMICVDDWTLSDLLAVRAWWSEAVCSWIHAERAGDVPEVPAPGYGWKDTPALNASIIERCRGTSPADLRARLRRAQEALLELVNGSSDDELLEPGRLQCAGSYTAARLIAMNSTRQYTTARTYIRRAVRESR